MRTRTLAGLAVALAGLVAIGPTAPSTILGDAVEPAETSDDVREITVDVAAVPCPEGYDNEADDDVCLAYDGIIPGPTWVFEAGQRVELTLRHDVTDTVDATGADAELADTLAEARYTLHRHGVSTAACEDGVARPQGTQICDSTVGPPGSQAPAGTVTYEFEAGFPGGWHYHDHALGLDAGVTTGPVLGAEAEHRGLFGTFLVLEDGAEEPARVFDLHLLDAGPNGGLGLDAQAPAGERFDLLLAGLGDQRWNVELEAPDGDLVGEHELGPGLSRPITVHDAEPGTYEWTAITAAEPGTEYSGQIEVTTP